MKHNTYTHVDVYIYMYMYIHKDTYVYICIYLIYTRLYMHVHNIYMSKYIICRYNVYYSKMHEKSTRFFPKLRGTYCTERKPRVCWDENHRDRFQENET